MANITDRAAYLRGLAEGMKLDREDNQQRLLLEMLDLMDEMAHQLADANAELAELQEYVEDIDTDLTDMEEILFGDDDCDCEDCMGDYDEDDEDDDQELSFDCPNCGKTVLLRASDIESEEDIVCKHCKTPFFADVEDDEE
ncbi:MAG: hypothetical protein E7331_10165 [Clostridiales bacterium]|nr:hypothetical protein [Clostridiales bacterium]